MYSLSIVNFTVIDFTTIIDFTTVINFSTVVTTATGGMACAGTNLRRLTCYLYHLCECLSDLIVLVAHLDVLDDICITYCITIL